MMTPMRSLNATFFLFLLTSSPSCLASNPDPHVLAKANHEPIAGFIPLTDVRDQNRIDKDQELIMQYAEAGDFDTAKAVYERGSFSKVVAVVKVTNGGLPVDLPSGITVLGKTHTAAAQEKSSVATSDSPPDAIMKVYEAYPAGALEIQLKYYSEGCGVGANPDPVLAGCLEHPGGTLYVPDLNVSFSYTNDIWTTRNDYEIQLFGNPAEYVFAYGDPFPPLYQWFVDYYGSDHFYDDFIQAAIKGTKTRFVNGNADFTSYSESARAQAVHKGSGYGAVWMYVFRELWHALYLCYTGDCAEDTCLNKPAVHEVDEAVAFWVGTLEGTDGAGKGVLPYALAEYLCELFGTCGDSTAKANIEIFKQFHDCSYNIVHDHCDHAQANTDRAIQIATIPLIQGALHYAYVTGRTQGAIGNDVDEAKGAVFAFLVVPIVHACNPDDADIIYQNLKTGQNNRANFDQVKEAFENNFKCMGLTPEDIGVYSPAIANENGSVDPVGVTHMAVFEDERGVEGDGGKGSGAATVLCQPSLLLSVLSMAMLLVVSAATV